MTSRCYIVSGLVSRLILPLQLFNSSCSQGISPMKSYIARALAQAQSSANLAIDHCVSVSLQCKQMLHSALHTVMGFAAHLGRARLGPVNDLAGRGEHDSDDHSARCNWPM